MKIPKRIKVGGVIYKVKQVKKINRIDENHGKTVGLWNSEKAVIYLDKNLEKQMKEQCFIHELFHALFDHCAIEQNEDKVDLLSTALYMVIKDNPKIFSGN